MFKNDDDESIMPIIIKVIFGYSTIKLIRIFPHIIIAYSVKVFFDDGWKVFWISLAAMVIYHLMVWLLNTIGGVFSYKLYLHKFFVNSVIKELEKFEFPSLSEYIIKNNYPEVSPENIYYDFFEAENLPCKVRIKAAGYLTEYKEATEEGKLILRMRMNEVHWDALIKYAQKHPDRVLEGY